MGNYALGKLKKSVEQLDFFIESNLQDINTFKEISHDVNEAIGIVEEKFMELETRLEMLEEKEFTKGLNTTAKRIELVFRKEFDRLDGLLRKEMDRRFLRIKKHQEEFENESSKTT